MHGMSKFMRECTGTREYILTSPPSFGNCGMLFEDQKDAEGFWLEHDTMRIPALWTGLAILIALRLSSAHPSLSRTL